MVDAGHGSDEGGRALALFDAAARHGAFHWTERRLYELTGAWAVAPAVPAEIRLHLFETSGQHAWHAQLWWDRLPVLAGVDRELWSRPAGRVVGPMLASLVPSSTSTEDRREGGDARGGEPGPHDDGGWPDLDTRLDGVGFLAVLCRLVLPRLGGSYRRHAEELVAATDRPSARALGFVLRDEAEQVDRGEEVLRALERDGAVKSTTGSVVQAYELAVRAIEQGEVLLPW
jgi:hypothetical protein